ncbi:MAG TPA: carboxypeptidase regulatory-like domain-containing protein, partial [Pyrinomonadaceae bacterium]|nr:carboxypeptidase regulatory-like domain-containing protein [Pyrinomonadaceae bacterium]
MLNSWHRVVYLIALLVFSATFIHAQSSTSRITGTVNDINGSAIEGATVTLTNEATGVTFTQVTTNDGVYAFTSLTAGRYTIAVEQSGFKKTVQTGNVLEVSTPLNVDLVLEIGGVNEVVTVVSDRETIQTNTATLGNVVDQKTIENLPLNGRNPLNLILQEPGIVQRSQGGAGSGVHINGSRDRAFNVTIDGIDANESSVPNPVSNLYRLNPDNVQEFKVTTNNATAEEGRNSGAAITLSTRTGGNGFHGTGFLFFRDDALNSTEFYANAQNLPKRETKLKQFGFELGGPVIKNKTFFFGSYQTNIIDFTQPIDQSFGVPIVYTAAARSGIFRYFRMNPANPLTINGTLITRNSPLLVDPATGNLRPEVPLCTTPTQLG